MQPGATMQAMANFQQAAAQAMQTAMQGMQGIPGFNMSALSAQPAGANPQQAYTDTMTAIAMQQAAAAAAAGQQVGFFPGAGFMPMMAWAPQAPPATVPQPQQQHHQQQAAQQSVPVPQAAAQQSNKETSGPAPTTSS